MSATPRLINPRPRRVWQAGLIAALFAAGAFFAGCQKEQRAEEQPTEQPSTQQPAQSEQGQQAQNQTGENKPLEIGGNDYGTFADYDTNGDQKVTETELKNGLQQNNLFAAWDRDNDNTLDKTEFSASMKTIADTNRDDVVDQQEYQSFTDTFGSDKVNFMNFTTLDVNGDDTLDTTEFNGAIDRSGLFAAWDPDSDESVDYNEYATGLVSVWDKNGDGVIEVDEFGFAMPQAPQVSQM